MDFSWAAAGPGASCLHRCAGERPAVCVRSVPGGNLPTSSLDRRVGRSRVGTLWVAFKNVSVTIVAHAVEVIVLYGVMRIVLG